MTAKADSAARQRIDGVTEIVMRKAAESLNAMVNHLVSQIREDEKFRIAIMVPGVNLELDVQVPDDLEQKITVLIAECVALDRVETIQGVVKNVHGTPDDHDSLAEILAEAKAEAVDITKAADKVRAAKPPVSADEAKPPGIVIPEGLVKCEKCGGVATPLTKCPRCGQDVGLKL